LLLLAVASTQAGQATTYARNLSSVASGAIQESGTAVSSSVSIPTVTLPTTQPLTIPTVSVPRPTAVPTSTPRPQQRKQVKARAKARAKKPVAAAKKQAVTGQWITAYLTSYCPGSAGWLSSSGLTVFYGMLANNYYPFGTHVYMPVLGITGVVEDHLGGFPSWNHFDVWSPTCYGTPTGFFPVAIQTG
jgi:hypothetical protein